MKHHATTSSLWWLRLQTARNRTDSNEIEGKIKTLYWLVLNDVRPACAMRTTCTWESGRCKTMLSPPGICWWPATHAKVKTPDVGDGHPSFNKEILILIKNPTIGLMIIPYYIGNNGSLDHSTIIVITLPNAWESSFWQHPSNLARRHAMASSRESCPPNFWITAAE